MVKKKHKINKKNKNKKKKEKDDLKENNIKMNL